MVKEFLGWIDVRDLEKVKVGKKFKASMPNRRLLIYDKHWYDEKCVQVLVTVSKKVK